MAVATRRWLVPSVCLLVGYVAGTSLPGLRADPQSAPPAVTPAFPMSDRLGANLYLETSAEYRACCLQIFRVAGDRLDLLLHRPGPRPTRPAVVMDLDETVLDNSAFETYLYNNKLEYTDALWEFYEEKFPQDVGTVPGAVDFIHRAESLGVTVLFVTNRLEKYRDSTAKALANVGIDTRDLPARTGFKTTTSDKSSRRDAFDARFNVLLHIGDNLRDFSESFAAPKLAKDAPASAFEHAIAARLKSADDAACHWGIDWFILPNPVYGEWEKLLGDDPRARMRNTTMPGSRTNMKNSVMEPAR